jgi:nitrile hydratase alpha subunit
MSPHDPHDHNHSHGHHHGHDHSHDQGHHHHDHDHAHPHTHDHAHTHDGHPILKYSDDSAHDVREAELYPLLAEALRSVLIERGVVSANDIREHLDALDKVDDGAGGRIVARAWTDPAFKKRLLENGSAAVGEFGIDMGETQLIVVENMADVHNLVVCTLCSCYPRAILGLPPDWYKSKSYRARAVYEPRSVLREFGTNIAESVSVRVHDSNADMRYLVLPQRPEGTEGWDADRLAALVSRDCLVGVVPAAKP